MSCRLIGGTTTDHCGSSGIFTLFDIAQSGFPVTLGGTSRAVDPEKSMAPCEEPICGFGPPFGVVMTIPILPKKLRGQKMFVS